MLFLLIYCNSVKRVQSWSFFCATCRRTRRHVCSSFLYQTASRKRVRSVHLQHWGHCRTRAQAATVGDRAFFLSPSHFLCPLGGSATNTSDLLPPSSSDENRWDWTRQQLKRPKAPELQMVCWCRNVGAALANVTWSLDLFHIHFLSHDSLQLWLRSDPGVKLCWILGIFGLVLAWKPPVKILDVGLQSTKVCPESVLSSGLTGGGNAPPALLSTGVKGQMVRLRVLQWCSLMDSSKVLKSSTFLMLSSPSTGGGK